MRHGKQNGALVAGFCVAIGGVRCTAEFFQDLAFLNELFTRFSDRLDLEVSVGKDRWHRDASRRLDD